MLYMGGGGWEIMIEKEKWGKEKIRENKLFE